MKRIRLGAAAMAAALVATAACVTPARADDGGILGDPGKVTGYADQVQKFYDLFNQFLLGHEPSELDQIKAAIVQSRDEIVSQIDAIAAAQVQACSATAVQQFGNIDRMSADTLQAFAASSVACVNVAAADIAAESDKAAVDKTGFALNIVGPIALFASADANERTDVLTTDLIAANQLLLQRLKPSCDVSALSPDDVPSVGEGGVTGHGVCLNYHRKVPPRVDGNVVWIAGPPPDVAYDPWYVRGLAQQIDDVFPNRGYNVFYPTPTDFSIAANAVLAVTSSPIADAALYELLPAIGRWGSPIAAGASSVPYAPIEALRVNGDGSVSRNEIHATDSALSGWTAMDGRLRSVAEASNADGRVEMFGTDRIGRVFHRWQQVADDDTSWSPWAQLSGQTISSLAVARNPDGTLQLFGTDPAGRIFTRHQVLGGDMLPEVQTGHVVPAIDMWTDWQRLDGTLTQIAAGVDQNGQMELFGVNAAGQVWDRRQTSPGGWTAWNRLDGALKTVAVASDLGGSLNLFGTDMDGTVWTRYQRGQNTELWSDWASLGGARMWNVAAAKESFGGGRVDLLGLDANGRIWLNSTDGIHGDAWRGWTPVPDTPAATPAVTSPGAQRNSLGAYLDLMLSASGGTAPYTLSITGLPPGLSASGSHIVGTPATAGTFTVSVSATDAVGTSGRTTTFPWTIVGVTVPSVVSESLAEARHDITTLGLVATVSTRKACLDPGNVLDQNPVGGAVVAPGSTVRITVDSGTASTCNIH